MSAHVFKIPGIIRSGFEYQDLIGLELLVAFFRDPEKYLWVELESEDPAVGYLDDIVAARPDQTFELCQVKFTPDPETYFLDWEWLLQKKPRGTSFLRKWYYSIERVSDLGQIHSVQLRTNRRPTEQFGKALKDRRIDLDLVPQQQRLAIEAELGSPEAASRFFAQFIFSHSEPLIDHLEARLKALIVPTDTDTAGWLLLREQARLWATRKQMPQPDGKITHQHLVQIITKKRAQPISQDFHVPAIYCPPAKTFHSSFIDRICRSDNAMSILWGSPGRGKSTYLSYLVEQLRQSETPIIRHHYFLSLDDTAGDRCSFPEIATSLMDQILVRYPDAVRGYEEDSYQLRKWIEACGVYFGQHGQRFLIVIDGLDHVWRETATTAQMEQLFNYLLPCPPNVSLILGTQRVPDQHLPYRLLQHAHQEDWIEIPAMDQGAVHQWMIAQNQAGRVRLHEPARFAENIDENIGSISSAFFQISNGHPLHLIYSFETLVRRGAEFTPDEILLLPVCPDGDIRKYYQGLWGRLSSNARQIIHLIAGSDFHWPPVGIRRCVGPIEEIDHLLEHRRGGVIPFHGSILAFVRERSDHDASFRALLPEVIQWLEQDAEEYWRWGWLWLMQAKMGNCKDLLQKTTRAWAMASLSAGWPDQQIVAILLEAERKAFEDGDYSRTIELRSLKTRLLNAEFQMQNAAELHECAIRSAANTQQIFNLADQLPTLKERQIVTLARASYKEAPDVLAECVEELRRRVNAWIDLRHRPEREFTALTQEFLKVIALASDIKIKSLLNFLRGFRGHEMFGFCIEYLTRERRLDALIEIARNLKSSDWPECVLLVHDAIVRTAAMRGVNIGARYLPRKRPVSPLFACWLRYHKIKENLPIAKPIVKHDIVREYYEHGKNEDLEKFFSDVFFYTLACLLRGRDFSSLRPGGERKGSAGWIDTAITFLEQTARQIASGGSQLTFATPYYEGDAIEPVKWQSASDAGHRQYLAFKQALRHIAVDLQFLKTPTRSVPHLSLSEIKNVRLSPHWEEGAWVAHQVEAQLPLLDLDAAKDTLHAAAQTQDATITPFNERAEKWTELAQFALLYSLPEVNALILRAANCMLGYYWRKDLWLAEVLDSIAEVHEKHAADGLQWLHKLVPIVERITEFTDGDETDSIRTDLIDTVAKVHPDRIPVFYAHHIAQDEYRYAEDALSAHCRILDFSHPISIALAHTFVERRDVVELGKLKEGGNRRAGKLEVDQVRFLC